MDAATTRIDALRARSFGLLLGALRRRAGLNQAALAEAWGVSVPTVKRSEAGRSQPPLDALVRLAGALGVPAGRLVDLVEALAAELVAKYEGALPGTRRRRLGSPLEAFVEGWLGSMPWVPVASSGILASWPRLPAGSVLASLDEGIGSRTKLGTEAPCVEPLGHAVIEGGAHEALAEVEAEVAVALFRALREGRPRVGARIPPGVESGRIAVRLAALGAADGIELTPLLYVASRASGRFAFISEARNRLPQHSSAAVADDGLPTRVALACCSAEAAQGLLHSASEEDGWCTVVVDGMPDAERLGLTAKRGTAWPGGVVAVLDNTLVERPSALREVLGAEPQLRIDVREAMARGLLPPLRYRGLPDPVDHREITRHLEWAHPGKKGLALSRDERLEALLEAGAFAPDANCVVHVADKAQAEWAGEWLSRRLGREVAAGSARIRTGGEGRSWLFQRVAHLQAEDHVDELVLLAPEFPRRMIGQIATGLRHASVARGLVVWDLLAADLPAQKRLASLLRWLGEEPGAMSRLTPTGVIEFVGGVRGASVEWVLAGGAGNARPPACPG